MAKRFCVPVGRVGMCKKDSFKKDGFFVLFVFFQKKFEKRRKFLSFFKIFCVRRKKLQNFSKIWPKPKKIAIFFKIMITLG